MKSLQKTYMVDGSNEGLQHAGLGHGPSFEGICTIQDYFSKLVCGATYEA